MIYVVKPSLSGHSKRRPKIGFQGRLLLNAGQKYCRMLQESILQYFSAILLTFIKVPFVLKTFVLSIVEWPLKRGFTLESNFHAPVLLNLLNLLRKSDKLLGKPRISSLFTNFFNKFNKT